jgi:hypothetical protein
VRSEIWVKDTNRVNIFLSDLWIAYYIFFDDVLVPSFSCVNKLHPSTEMT